jgi:RNA ligase (TIGR02306 family)
MSEMNVRRLATIEEISAINPIADADAIVRSRVRGWDVVTRLDEFSVGDRCVYVEVDSFIPTSDERFEFLAKRGIRKDATDKEGYVLKTAKLRGVYSQGLALSISLFPEFADLPIGANVTEQLGIIVWEPKIAEELIGFVKGMRPSWIPSTDENRLQNISEILSAESTQWVATEKIDGMSTTIYVDGQSGETGVCTRNLDLIETPEATLWAMTAKLDLHGNISRTWPTQRVAIQGETFGEGIQGNPLKLRGRHFAAFTLRVDGSELPRGEWPTWLLAISVPIHDDLTFPSDLESALSAVESLKSKLSPECAAEGIVWRALEYAVVKDQSGSLHRASFKVISNKYLLKHDL